VQKPLDSPNNEAYHEADETFRFYLEILFREVSILAERLAVPSFSAKIDREFALYGRDQLTTMDTNPWDARPYSTALAKVDSFYQSLATMTDGNAVTGIDIFKTILQNTAAIVKSKQLAPSKEAGVRAAIFEILQFAFHDAVREIPIAHLFKTYKPDMGVRSLMAAAEYKFADTEAEVKKALGEIYEDMHGYSGHDEWRNFFAVIYTTDAIAHQNRWKKSFVVSKLIRAGRLLSSSEEEVER
jgi:hypothetical protein